MKIKELFKNTLSCMGPNIEHGVKVGPGPRDLGPRDPGTLDLGPPRSLKV